jgi:hypothetical protein
MCSETGWRVRVFTNYGTDGRPSDSDLRAAWSPDRRTVVVNFDASNPNLMNFPYIGDEVLAKLRRPWWFELQGRFGNMFFVRDEVRSPTWCHAWHGGYCSGISAHMCMGYYRRNVIQVTPGQPDYSSLNSAVREWRT